MPPASSSSSARGEWPQKGEPGPIMARLALSCRRSTASRTLCSSSRPIMRISGTHSRTLQNSSEPLVIIATDLMARPAREPSRAAREARAAEPRAKTSTESGKVDIIQSITHVTDASITTVAKTSTISRTDSAYWRPFSANERAMSSTKMPKTARVTKSTHTSLRGGSSMSRSLPTSAKTVEVAETTEYESERLMCSTSSRSSSTMTTRTFSRKW